MKNVQSFSLDVNTRSYCLKIYGEPLIFPLSKDIEYRECSLFIFDNHKQKISNHQPINKIEVAFRFNEKLNEIIARLALNFDEDLPVLNDVRDKLISIVEKKIPDIKKIDTEDLGYLPI